MADVKHTPGPWHPWHNGGVVGRVVCEVERLFGRPITIRGPELPMGSVEDHEYEANANARLIAAAPEMLEALKKADELLASIHERHTKCDGPIWQQIRQAISKAESNNV